VIDPARLNPIFTDTVCLFFDWNIDFHLATWIWFRVSLCFCLRCFLWDGLGSGCKGRSGTGGTSHQPDWRTNSPPMHDSRFGHSRQSWRMPCPTREYARHKNTPHYSIWSRLIVIPQPPFKIINIKGLPLPLLLSSPTSIQQVSQVIGQHAKT